VAVRSAASRALQLHLGPAADLVDQGDGGLAVEGLGVEQVLVAKRHGVLGEEDEHLRADFVEARWLMPILPRPAKQ